MPGFAVSLRRLFSVFVTLLVVKFVWQCVRSKPEAVDYNVDRDAIRRLYREKNLKSPRSDLKPDVVYRGSNIKANSSDLGLVKNREEKEEMEVGYRDFAYNVLVSRRLGPFRELPDTRHKTCSDRRYSEVLPTASVIICFYNEHVFTLIRTVESVLRRSPDNILHEVILVNDGSSNNLDHVHTQLKQIEWRRVRMLHTGGREGLIRARILGARNATGDALVFLDSHVECNIEWLQPLMQQIKDSQTNVATPIIDSIDPDTFTYKPSPLVRGGMNMGLIFKWAGLPDNYLDKPEKFSEPILSPTMAGGLFAISRKYFKYLGEYDSGLEIWGGENIELSLRIWLCGGRLDIVPCSRVGHIFRKRRPYTSTNSRGEDTQTLNVARVARVWLGEYMKYFDELVPDAANMDIGDISTRVELKHRLGCKDFSWFHKNIFPELELPGEQTPVKSKNKVKFQRWDEKEHNFTGSFQLVNPQLGLCGQPTLGTKHKGSTVSLWKCARKKEQFFFQTASNELLPGGYLCLDASKSVRLQKCTEMEGPQRWTLPSHSSETSPARIYNPAAGLCLGVEETRLITVICDQHSADIWYLKPVEKL